MKTRWKTLKDQLLLALLLTAMIILLFILWAINLSQHPPGKSRVPWPHEATSTAQGSH